MEITETDLNKVFNYKEVQIYLSFTDIIKLSTCSFKLRNILYGENLKPFQVREYLKKEDFRTFEVEVEGKGYTYDNPFQPPRDIIQASVNQFEIELQSLNPTVETLIIHDIYDFLYGYKIADRFVNITTLILNSCTITEKMLQYLLKNLKLSKLSIKSASIMCEEDYCTDIIMPQSLKNIEFIDAKHSYANIETDVLYFCWENYYGWNGDLHLSKQHIESLTDLYYRAQGSGHLTKFIELNPQLKSLTLRQYGLSRREKLALIKNNQIEHLDSELSIDPISEDDPHIFESLKSLVTLVGSDTNSKFNIAKSCPNLISLTTFIGTILNINNSIYYASQLKNLKYYSLKSYKNQTFKEVINFPVMSELTELELTNFNPENLNWSQLSLFPKLKMVKFLGYHVKSNCNSFVSEIQNTKTWKLVAIGDSRTYHKL